MTEVEKACLLFSCSPNGKTQLEFLYGIGVLLCASHTNSLAPGSLPFGADYVARTYIGSTNNIDTETYKTGGAGGATVAVLTYTYVGAGAADDDEIATITRT